MSKFENYFNFKGSQFILKLIEVKFDFQTFTFKKINAYLLHF